MSVKPHLDPQRCKRWIELTGRDVGIEKIKSYSYICQVSTYLGWNFKARYFLLS